MQQPQAHLRKLHVSEGLPTHVTPTDAKIREEDDAGRLVAQEHDRTVIKSRHLAAAVKSQLPSSLW